MILCTQPALNAVLQGPYFEDESLQQLTGGGPIDAYAVNMALRSFNLSLEPIASLRRQTEPHMHNAFVCFQHQRWFALRRIGKHWLNLNDIIGRPAQILPHQLSVSLSQLQDDGCEIYAVLGQLPACAADQSTFFDTHFLWFLSGGVLPDSEMDDHLSEHAAHSELCPRSMCPHQPCECDQVYEDAFEDDLQAAIAASLVEAQPSAYGKRNKPLAIKTTSPPTSLISSEAEAPPPQKLSLDNNTAESDGVQQQSAR